MRRPTFKPSLAQTRRDNQAALDYYRALSPNKDAPRIDVGAKAKRERAAPNPATSEAPVLAAVGHLLARHPRVAFAARINSGMSYDSRGVPVWFHKILRGPGRISDYIGLLLNGPFFVMECKPPGWEWSPKNRNHEREIEQQKFIEHTIAAGGIGGFVRSVDEALAVIEGRRSG